MRRRLLNRPQRGDPSPPRQPPPAPPEEECVAPAEPESCSSDSSDWGDSAGPNEADREPPGVEGVEPGECSSRSDSSSDWGDNEADCNPPEGGGVPEPEQCDSDLTNVTPASISSSSSSSSCPDSFGLDEEGNYVAPPQSDESRYSSYWDDAAEDDGEQAWVEVDEEYTLPDTESDESGDSSEEPGPDRTFGDELFQMAGYSDVWDLGEMFPGCDDDPEDENVVRESLLRRDEQLVDIHMEPSRAIWSGDPVNPDETGYSSIHECEIYDRDSEGRDQLRRRRLWTQYERALEAGDDVQPLVQQFRQAASPRGRSLDCNIRSIMDSQGWADSNVTPWSFDASGAGDESEMYCEDEDDDALDFSPTFTSSPSRREMMNYTC